MPSSSATSTSVTPSSFARRNASRLNSALYRFLRLISHLPSALLRQSQVSVKPKQHHKAAIDTIHTTYAQYLPRESKPRTGTRLALLPKSSPTASQTDRDKKQTESEETNRHRLRNIGETVIRNVGVRIYRWRINIPDGWGTRFFDYKTFFSLKFTSYENSEFLLYGTTN